MRKVHDERFTDASSPKSIQEVLERIVDAGKTKHTGNVSEVLTRTGVWFL